MEREGWAGVIERRLPDSTRWSLVALGAVEGRRIRQPRDPVAAWLLRRNPGLQPTVVAPQTLTMIRARASIVDRMLLEEVARARLNNLDLSYWSFGGGFDARWYRLMPSLSDVVRVHHEVEEPSVLEFKESLLVESSFSSSWAQVQRVPLPVDRWTVDVNPGHEPLIVLEGVWSRIGDEGLRALLSRLAAAAPGARVLLDLPVIGPQNWSLTGIRALGWQRDEEVWLARRRQLVAPTGVVICPGMEPIRVLRLTCPPQEI